MTQEIKVPVLPESVSDATVATWHKKPGEFVRRDENLVDLETDKVVLEVPSPCDGTVADISEDTGALVTTGQVLGTVEEGEAPAESAPAAEAAPAAAAAPEAAPAAEPDPAPAAPAAESANADNLSPSVRKMVTENQLDAGSISGTGRDGRITKGDVLRHMEGGPAAGAVSGPRPEERVAMTRLRQRIAQRMVDANNTAAMLTSFNEVDLSAVIALRNQHKDRFAERHGVKLGFMSFFVKASAEALKRFPIVNASIDGDDVVYHGYQDIGIAVASDRGLVVPILRDAGHMSFAEIEQGIRTYAVQAKERTLKLEDLTGGTFTVSNGGTFGSLLSTPILNMPQSAILGMHAIKERAVVVDGEVVARPMMYIALTYDHRIIDGKDAVLFLVAIKDALEDPARLLLDI
ncbi:MAG: 2-oxoglutarate dehydrogenase complex dihydrolipoyllysine-residue succinyltransferase [Pseudomonadota bacterium]